MPIPTLGSRGQGWVAVQLAALAGIGLAGFGRGWPSAWAPWTFAAGAALATAGAVLALGGVKALGSSLTAMPKPRPGAPLRASGVYARARHPIYGGLLLIGVGFAGMTSPWGLVPWAALVAILLAKSGLEERWLLEHDPGYADYRARVRRRFVPFVI
jgi:protein-S-isoprenylcysteine O-methyltransferase Ste14